MEEMNSREKCEMLKDTIYQLYTKEGRSKVYISNLLKINRKILSEMINDVWKFPDPIPMRHLKPSNEKFLNKNKDLIKSRLDNDFTLDEIANELGISRKSLYCTFILSDDILKKANEDRSRRIHEKAQFRRESMMEKSSREYFYEDYDGEEWKPLMGYDGYEISNLGRVRKWNPTYKEYSMLHPTPNERNMGRMQVGISKDGKTKNFNLARLVAHNFVPGYSEERNTVNHKDGNVQNNFAENLEWMSQGENNKHSYDHLNRTKVNFRRFKFDKILYKGKYEFKTVAAFAKFLGKSETQTRRYMEEPEKYEIELIKNCND